MNEIQIFFFFRKDDWLIYDETEDIMPLILIPDMNSNVSCSKELPHPFENDYNTNKTR